MLYATIVILPRASFKREVATSVNVVHEAYAQVNFDSMLDFVVLVGMQKQAFCYRRL